MNESGGQRQVRIAPMELADIPQVIEIDRLSFPIPWSAAAYQHEITDNPAAHFLVAVDPSARSLPGLVDRLLGRRPARKVIGYAGFWLMIDEAHVGTFAVHPSWRRQGVGEQLLVALLGRASDLGAMTTTLEVRVSNQAAQDLYRKYAFEEVGKRKRYYRDNHEDALLMSVGMDQAYRNWIRDRQAAEAERENI